LVKGVTLFILGRLFKLHIAQSLVFGFALCQVGEFAFVLFSFSAQKGILTQPVIDIMIAAVAVSMALTPLLLLLNEKLLQPRFSVALREVQEADAIDESHPVIIAGFGHFGNTIGRFLRAHSIGMTILDNNADRVDLLRKMGFKVYYGDASRYDLLYAAGAATARLIIIALEPAEKRLELIETVKKHFPDLRMLVRATNRYDAYDQMNAGMLHVYRETVDTALRVGVDAMIFLGLRRYTAQRAARTFFRLDEANLKKLAAIKDEDEYIVTAREKIEELERVLQADQNQRTGAVDRGWDEEGLIADANRPVLNN
jgi:voltage-gated potassium channel Kch